jgi:hypothetical protein
MIKFLSRTAIAIILLVSANYARAQGTFPGLLGPGQVVANHTTANAVGAPTNPVGAAISCPSWLTPYDLFANTTSAPTGTGLYVYDTAQCVQWATLNQTAHTLGLAMAGPSYINSTLAIGATSPTSGAQLTVNGDINIAASSYLTFGATDGASGYGLRDNSGTPQVKSSGGAFANIVDISSAQTLTNKSISGPQINSGTIPSAQIPAINPGTTSNGGLAYATGHVNVLRNSSLTAWFHGCFSGACTATTTAATTNYCAEGVFVLPTGASVTCQATATVPAGSLGFNALKITGAASNTDIKVRFVVESYSAAKIAGLATTFQFTFINNSGATITPALSTKFPTTQDGGVTGGAAWGASTADLSATNLTACTNGSTCLEAYTLTASASAINGYEFVVDFGAMASNADSITIGAGFDARATPSISTGINATPPSPEVRSPAEDITWSQRFYLGSYNNQVAPGTATHVGIAFVSSSTASGMTALNEIVFPVQMRATPTLAFWDGAGNASKVSSIPVSGASLTFTDNQTNAAAGIIGTGAAGFADVASATSTAGLYAIQYTADASLWGG